MAEEETDDGVYSSLFYTEATKKEALTCNDTFHY